MPRSFSLQREWSGAFTLMLLALFIGASVTVVGVRFVVNEMEAAAGRLESEYGSVAELAAALETHEQMGHQLLTAGPVHREAFVLEQQDIEELFRVAAAAQAADEGRPEALSAAQQDWQAGLENAGLWGDDDGTPATGPVAERIYEALSEPFVIGDRSLRVSLSMGVAQRTENTADVTELLRQADSAMYRAKHGGKPGTKSTAGQPRWLSPSKPSLVETVETPEAEGTRPSAPQAEKDCQRLLNRNHGLGVYAA